MLAPTWTVDHRHDRRKHAFRCRCCNKVISDGEPTIFARMVKGNRYWAIHEACGDKRHSDTYSWREIMHEWSVNPVR